MGAGVRVVAHFPGAQLRGEGEGEDLIERGLFLRRRLVGERGEVVGNLGLDGRHGIALTLFEVVLRAVSRRFPFRGARERRPSSLPL